MKVLLVEDDRKLSHFLYRAFAEEGYVVDLCRTGNEAVMQVEMVSYDLMVLDWMLPDQDGISACRQLRARGHRVPILMLTARTEVADKVIALNAGADDYLTKPFHLNELMARSRSLIRRAGAPSDQTLRVGQLTLDFRARVARVAGQEINLTAREFVLLSLLVRNAGRVVTRTEILEQVWSTHSEPGSNMISVHIRHLREKLGPAADYLETIRGQGFRLALREPS